MDDTQVQHKYGPSNIIKKMLPDNGPSAFQVVAVITITPLCGVLLTLAGITLVGTIVSLVVSVPIFILFSPVLVPAALTIGFSMAGFLASGVFGVTGISTMAWMMSYFRQLIGKFMVWGINYFHQLLDTVSSLSKTKLLPENPSLPRNRLVANTQSQHEDGVIDSTKSMLFSKFPSKSQIISTVTTFFLSGVLFTFCGITLVGTLISLVVSAPIFLLFSPVLVPAAVTIGLFMIGFLTSGVFGLTGMSSLAWTVYNFYRLISKVTQ